MIMYSKAIFIISLNLTNRLYALVSFYRISQYHNLIPNPIQSDLPVRAYGTKTPHPARVFSR